MKKEEEPKSMLGMDELDRAAAREGLAIRKMNKYRVKKTNNKPKVRPVG